MLFTPAAGLRGLPAVLQSAGPSIAMIWALTFHFWVQTATGWRIPASQDITPHVRYGTRKACYDAGAEIRARLNDPTIAYVTCRIDTGGTRYPA